jgi:hypothetical protein
MLFCKRWGNSQSTRSLKCIVFLFIMSFYSYWSNRMVIWMMMHTLFPMNGSCHFLWSSVVFSLCNTTRPWSCNYPVFLKPLWLGILEDPGIARTCILLKDIFSIQNSPLKSNPNHINWVAEAYGTLKLFRSLLPLKGVLFAHALKFNQSQSLT